MLGVHTSTVSITDLSGAAIAHHPLPRDWSEVTWRRSLSETSTATAVLTSSRPGLRDLIEPWEHIVTVHRDGVPVWTGPVIIPTTQGASITLECHDPTILFTVREVHYEMSWANHDVARIAAAVIRSAVGGDDPYGVSAGMVVAPMGTSRYTDYYIRPETKTVSEVLSDLVDRGLEWTYAGGRLYLGPVHREMSTAPITERHLAAAPAVSKDGSAMATSVRIIGRGVSAAYTDRAAPIRLDRIVTQDSITNAGACFDDARRRVKSASRAPYRIVPGTSKLLPTAAVEMRELVPGVGVPLSVVRQASTVDTVLRLTGTRTDAATDTTDITLDSMPVDLEPQEFASPSVGTPESDDLPTMPGAGSL